MKDEQLLVEWEMWNTALSLINGKGGKPNFQQYQEEYKKAVDLARIGLLQLNTPENAAAHWLIAQQLEATPLF